MSEETRDLEIIRLALRIAVSEGGVESASFQETLERVEAGSLGTRPACNLCGETHGREIQHEPHSGNPFQGRIP